MPRHTFLKWLKEQPNRQRGKALERRVDIKSETSSRLELTQKVNLIDACVARVSSTCSSFDDESHSYVERI